MVYAAGEMHRSCTQMDNDRGRAQREGHTDGDLAECVLERQDTCIRSQELPTNIQRLRAIDPNLQYAPTYHI